MTVVALPPFLTAEFRRLDSLLARCVLAMRMRRALADQEFRGLYVSDAQIDAALAGQGRLLPAKVSLAQPQPEIGPSTPWQRVTSRLELGPAERDVLLLALAAQMDRRYEAVFAYLNDAMTLRVPTVDLALRVFEGLPGVAEALAPGAPLVRMGAIETQVGADAWRSRTLIASDLIALKLLGVGPDGLVAGLSPAPTDANAGPTDPDLVARIRDCPTAPLIHVTGSGSALRRRTAAGILRGLRLRPFVYDCAPGVERRLALAARLFPLGIILDGASGQVDAALSHWPVDVPLAISGGRLPAELSRPVLQRVATAPSTKDVVAAWCRAADCAPKTARMLAQGFDFAPAQIARIAASAALDGGGDAALIDAARAARVVDFGPLAQHIPVHRLWGELVLPRPTADALKDVATAVERRREVLVSWGFGAERGGGALSVLFAGPSGTGKTMAAGALAGRTGLNLYRIDLSAVVDKYIGETEKNLERIFEAASGCDSMLLFDEADALFGKRSETRDARDRYANLEVSYLLQRIESLPPGMVVILTTNLAKNMDQAFARRLTHVVDFPRPTAKLRRRMWADIFPSGAPLDPEVDLERIADAFDLTGGEIRQVALDAAFRAAGLDRPIGAQDIADALRRHYQKLGRTAPERDLERLVLPAARQLPAAE